LHATAHKFLLFVPEIIDFKRHFVGSAQIHRFLTFHFGLGPCKDNYTNQDVIFIGTYKIIAVSGFGMDISVLWYAV
jgi:hypothetical protein